MRIVSALLSAICARPLVSVTIIQPDARRGHALFLADATRWQPPAQNGTAVGEGSLIALSRLTHIFESHLEPSRWRLSDDVLRVLVGQINPRLTGTYGGEYKAARDMLFNPEANPGDWCRRGPGVQSRVNRPWVGYPVGSLPRGRYVTLRQSSRYGHRSRRAKFLNNNGSVGTSGRCERTPRAEALYRVSLILEGRNNI
jgi:hypothetical protein